MSFAFHLSSLKSALVGFERALACPKDEHDLVIDGSIQRFEYCFELCWKTMSEALLMEGLSANSPKETFKKALAAGWIIDEEPWLVMLEDRNLTTHTYFIDMAERVYSRLKNHCRLISQMLDLLSTRHA